MLPRQLHGANSGPKDTPGKICCQGAISEWFSYRNRDTTYTSTMSGQSCKSMFYCIGNTQFPEVRQNFAGGRRISFSLMSYFGILADPAEYHV